MNAINTLKCLYTVLNCQITLSVVNSLRNCLIFLLLPTFLNSTTLQKVPSMLKKHSFLLLGIVTILAGCQGGYNGQLLGSLDRPGWNVTIPYGMVYIRSGTLHIGQNDQDINNSMTQRTKAVSVQGFLWMKQKSRTTNTVSLWNG